MLIKMCLNASCSIGDALSTILFLKFALEYIMLSQENEESKEWRGHQPLVGADVNLLVKNISQKKKVLLDATKFLFWK